jgi:hypothetical protein
MIDNNRRHFSRISFDSMITLSQNGKSWTAKLQDLSLKGILIEKPLDWDADISQWIQACLTHEESDLIHMTVNWRRSHDNQLGFEYQHIDIDSIAKLRQLLILKLGDESLLNRELEMLGN